jgi:hypothetical protein
MQTAEDAEGAEEEGSKTQLLVASSWFVVKPLRFIRVIRVIRGEQFRAASSPPPR